MRCKCKELITYFWLSWIHTEQASPPLTFLLLRFPVEKKIKGVKQNKMTAYTPFLKQTSSTGCQVKQIITNSAERW